MFWGWKIPGMDNVGGLTVLPKDPVILLSFVNTKLRDEYGSLEELCAALDANEAELKRTLAALDYHYDPAYPQFI